MSLFLILEKSSISFTILNNLLALNTILERLDNCIEFNLPAAPSIIDSDIPIIPFNGL
jgi:hypothetical protein